MKFRSSPATPPPTTEPRDDDVRPRPAILAKVLRPAMATALAAALMTGAAAPALALAAGSTTPTAAAAQAHGHTPNGDPGGW